MENCAFLPDEELHRSIKEFVKNERRNLTGILSRLAEMDRRRLAQKMGHHSLFEYCLKELRYSEAETAIRIHAARAAEKFPVAYAFLRTGKLSLTALSKLAPHLTHENHRELLRQALGGTKRKIEALVSEMNPEPMPREVIRPVAIALAPSPPGLPAASFFELTPGPESAEQPRSVRRVQFSFTADESFLDQVERAKELLRHKHPFGRLEDIFSEALQALLPKIDPGRRFAGARKAENRDPGTRKIPNWVKKEVWRRDGGRCVFVGPGGVVCASSDGPEFDHLRPFALGGRSDDPSNIRILCRAHNDVEARRVFGDAWMDRAARRN